MIEVNQEPGPELRIMDHESPGTWLSDMRARGFTVPLQLCRHMSHAMTALGLSFAEVFQLLSRRAKIQQIGAVLIYDLSSPKLWEAMKICLRIRVRGPAVQIRRDDFLHAARRASRRSRHSGDTTRGEGARRS